MKLGVDYEPKEGRLQPHLQPDDSRVLGSDRLMANVCCGWRCSGRRAGQIRDVCWTNPRKAT